MVEKDEDSVVRKMPIETGPSWMNDIKQHVGKYINEMRGRE